MNKFKKGLKVKSVDLKLPTMYNMYNEDGMYVGKINPSYEKIQNKWLKTITILFETEDEKLLMQQRGNTQLTPNQLDFCSGHVENEETYIQTAYREAKEELGLDYNKISNLTQILEPLPIGYKEKGFFIQFFYGKINSKYIKIDHKEVESYIKEDISLAFQKLRDRKTRFPYNCNEKGFENIIQEFHKIREQIKENQITR